MTNPNKVAEPGDIYLKKARGSKPDLSVEARAIITHTQLINNLRGKINKEFTELKNRQEKVRFLQKLKKTINSAITDKGEFDASNNPQLQTMLDEATKLGVERKEGVYKFTKEACDRLLQNIQITVEDFNVSNDSQLQTMTRLTNDRYESFQMTMMMLKTDHESKTQMARNIK